MNKLYTLSEAADRLAVLRNRNESYSRQYMYKLCVEGKLKCQKIGKNGNMYVTTEEALRDLIPTIKKVGRPKNS
ncbi:hypothetical protein [Alteribacillus sp. YIM 98480]|uniref:hypothetical protein n=1 Tax=Alteribacillus sp. YIM 98480 TaxID=2606599 RepID=UPI00131E8CD3|nr:hypothetical protein [Alteribacillus sp. YIM 98480]